MWVRPAHRGRGLAGQLIDAAREWSVRDGASELMLWVVEGNVAAVRAYAHAGFEETGRRQPLPRRPEVIETEWRLPLRPSGPPPT
jgi:GNAT superfamily N-acetyltransferase